MSAAPALAVSQAEAVPLRLAAGAIPPLALSGVCKSWAGRPVLEDVDVVLRPGEIAWLGGRNGAGKTTLLRIASALIRPDRGSVRVLGIDPERRRRDFQARLGFLSAGDRGLYARLNGRRHLEFWAAMTFLPRVRQADAIERAIADFTLAGLLDRRVDRLSLGQRQRLRLAMAFMHEPTVVLLDEPRNSLDDDGLATLQAALERLAARGGAAIWCAPSGDRLDHAFTRRWVIEDARLKLA